MNDYIVNAFTKTEDVVNLEVNNLNVDCITSRNNNFNLDSEGNLSVKSVTVEQGTVSDQVIRDLVYPIGSIFISANNLNPNTTIGGTWEQIKDKFLLACGDNYSIGTIGGEAVHTLTIAEMPRHDHYDNYYDTSVAGLGNGTDTGVGYTYGWGNRGTSVHTGLNGNNQPHNNMPPYLAVCVWKRIA